MATPLQSGENGPEAFVTERRSVFESGDFRKALGKFPSGVIVLTVVVEGEVHGMTAASFCSVSLHPPLIGVAVGQRARMHEFLEQSTRFGVSVLSREQQALSDHFAGRCVESVNFDFIEIAGIPVIAGALAHLCCTVESRCEAGDHTMYIGRVEHLDFREGEEPLVFFGSRYRSLENTNGE